MRQAIANARHAFNLYVSSQVISFGLEISWNRDRYEWIDTDYIIILNGAGAVLSVRERQ